MTEGIADKEQVYRRNASVISLLVGLALLVAKFWAYRITNSQAVFSDALESIVNIAAAAMAIFVIYYAAKPVDEDHPYGHGKIEFFSAAFEGGLIAFAALLIFVKAGESLLSGVVLNELSLGIYIVLAAGVGNLLLGLFLVHRGKKYQSVALRASGYHVISDFWTSLGIVVGLGAVKLTGITWLDPVVALIVASFLGVNGLKIMRESIRGLMDEEDLDALESLRQVLDQKIGNGVIQIHHMKMIRSGRYHHLDAHIVLPEFWTVDLLHEKLLRLEKEIFKTYPAEGELNFHLDPCRKVYCKHCNLEGCNIRQDDFESLLPVKIEHLRSRHEPEQFDPPAD